jgi:pilus assembly protein Flp/PilA
MQALARLLERLAADRSGATAIEYGVIVGLIFLAILASITAVADGTVNMFQIISSAMS